MAGYYILRTMLEFPVSGVETYWWLPMVVAFGISSMTSAGGVTGAFILLPFQMSVLGFVGPAVTPTNLVYNIVAIPGGVYRYWREQRMMWSLACTLVLGLLPGIFLGAVIRIKFLPDPRNFKLFVGCVMLYLIVRVGLSAFRKKQETKAGPKSAVKFGITPLSFSLKTLDYEFNGVRYRLRTWVLLLICAGVGIIGGAYGIGGGAFLSPILVSIFGLPVYTVAGASLLGTFVSSIAGVVFYTGIAPLYADSGLAITPDFLLGAMFGVGGAAGVYVGARLQKFIPAPIIKIILCACLLFISARYISSFFLR